jgi:hypothetical protein
MPRAQADASPKKRKPRSRPTPKWLTQLSEEDNLARSRTLLVLSVLSGEKPVTTVIEEAGISRGFYYQLETKALNGMIAALAPDADASVSPGTPGLRQQLQEVQQKLAKAEAAQRRAERMLAIHRKLARPGPLKIRPGRPPKTTTPSTPGGNKSWRSSTMTTPTNTTSTTRSTRPRAASHSASSDGANGAPSGGSENSRAPTPRATT